MMMPVARRASRSIRSQNGFAWVSATGAWSSQSTRTTCWRSAMIRVLTMVRRPSISSRPSSPTPPAASTALRSAPAVSRPSTPPTAARPPSERTFHAVLLAPPGMLFSCVTDTTGTGASGEMRWTAP